MSNQVPSTVEFAPYFRAQQSMLLEDRSVMQSIFELRFQVYCIECGFLNAEDYPSGQESDEHDADSAHFCAHNLRGDLVGYVRLVPPDVQTGRFLWQRYCTTVLDDVRLPPADEAAEISRLMVRGDYRRRRGDTLIGLTEQDENAPTASDDRRVESPQILLSLYRQMYVYSVRTGIRHWYAAMERPLARSLARMGFAFRQVGEEVDYFGPVAPYVADLRELEQRLEQASPALLAWMQKPETSHD